MTIKNASPRNDDVLQKKWSTPPIGVIRHKHGVDFSNDPGRTDPSQAADADINNIVARFKKTGVLPGTNVQQVFADISDAPSYTDAMQIVINAQNAFMALDAKTRKKFDNSPHDFLAFVDNPANASELVNMGLATLSAPHPSPAAPEPRGGQPRSSPKTPEPKPTSEKDET